MVELQDKEWLISSVLSVKTLAIIGLEKNTGKTETLNFVVQHIKKLKTIGLTSIGTDGEEKDIVFGTLKPSVYVDSDFVYTTTELFFKRRAVLSEILHVSNQSTPTGRVIIARTREPGKVILSGPPSTVWMNEVVNKLHQYTELVIVDGALSRFSQANPTIADGVILATGAAYSLDKKEIIKHTKYVYNLCNLPTVDEKTFSILNKKSVICICDGKEWQETELKSALDVQRLRELSSDISSIYIPGALTDNVLKHIHDKEIIVKDFTKIFVSYEQFFKYKPKIKVLEKSNIIGITINPYSPAGYILDSESIIKELKEIIQTIPIIDVRR